MKIALENLKGVTVLVVSDAITEHDVEVLRAGLVKIFKTGKNKIILELPKNDSLHSNVIRELATFDVMARELAGRIVIAGVSPSLRTKIEVFASPPVILTFETREKALEFFAPPPPPPAAPAASPATAGHDAVAEALKHEQSSLKARVQELEQENKLLREQVVLATIARRPPTDEVGYLEKIQALETKIEKLLLDAQQAPAAPAKPS